MAYLFDPDSAEPDSNAFDESGVFCPRCGCAAHVVTYPRGTPPRQNGGGWKGSWYGSTSGKAECLFCGIRFGIFVDDSPNDQDEPQDTTGQPPAWMRHARGSSRPG